MSITVVGSGVTGLTLASRLSRALPSYTITLLTGSKRYRRDEGDGKGDKNPNIDLRTYALTPDNFDLVKKAGYKAARHGTYDRMQVWDHHSPSFVSWGDPRRALGYIVEDGAVCNDIQDSLGSNVNYVTEARLCGVDDFEGTVTYLHGSGGGGKEELKSALVVAADGASSFVRGSVGFKCTQHSYGRVALVATIATSSPASTTAYQRFFRNGPVAVLPLWDGYQSVIWSTTKEEAELIKSRPGDFVDVLNDKICGGPESVGGGLVGSFVDGLGLGVYIICVCARRVFLYFCVLRVS